jgi:hypothetical protein
VPAARPSAPTISAMMASVSLPPESVLSEEAGVDGAGVGVLEAAACSSAAAVTATVGAGLSLPSGPIQRNDLAVGVRLQCLERERVAGLAWHLDREAEVLEGARWDALLARPGDLLDAFGDLAVVGLDRLGELGLLDLHRPAGHRLVRREREPVGQLQLNLRGQPNVAPS